LHDRVQTVGSAALLLTQKSFTEGQPIMPRFEGEKRFPLTAAEVWDKLADAAFLVQCVPGVESVRESSRESASFVIRPGFSFVRGTLEVSLRIIDPNPPRSFHLLIQSKGIGSSSKVTGVVTLASAENQTKVDWQAELAELGGLLKAVPPGLLKASAQKVIADVWSTAEAKLSAK
jgi:carbon monoxide dehydrogenase subunit G